jgi:hypothetical protein
VSLESIAQATYSCLNCRAELEAKLGAWDGWLRCPACGRVSLPPEPVGLPNESQPPAAASALNGVPEPAFTPGPDVPLEFRRVAAGRMAHTSLARLIFTTGLVLCLLLSLIYFIDFKPIPLGIFGFLSIVFFLLLLRTPRTRVSLANSWWNGKKAEAETAGRNDD